MPNDLKIEEKSDVWTYLSTQSKPIVMYGMGNGADKILNVFLKYNIAVSDFFASDGFVRGHFFKGKKVLSFDEIKEKYSDFIIILSFASNLESVLSYIEILNEKYELYAPCVPAFGNELFDYDYYLHNYDNINKAYLLLSDNYSRIIYKCMIEYYLSGKIEYLLKTQDKRENIISDVLKCDKYKNCADGGAYTGDSVLEFIENFKNIKQIFAFEPDEKNYKKLCKNINERRLSNNINIQLFNFALFDKDTELEFECTSNRNTALSDNISKTVITHKTKRIVCKALDNVLLDNIDFIKLDVEGCEKEAINGAAKAIKHSLPDMQISIYHKSCDIFSLILQINLLAGSKYNYYLRRIPYIPAWDLCLYTIKNEEYFNEK